jgi:flagella basal body P-ring formation protein FlgA
MKNYTDIFKITKIKIVGLCLSMMLFNGLLHSASTAEYVVNIKPAINVASSEILLRDLVADTASLPQDWAKREVLRAPPTVESVTVPLITIAYALQQYPDMKNLSLRGVNEIVVSRSGRLLTTEELEKIVQDHTENNLPWRGEKTRIENLNVTRGMVVPAGSSFLRVVRADPLRDRSAGWCFTIGYGTENEIEGTFKANADIVILDEVWVAARPLPDNHKISEEDLTKALVPRDDVQKCFTTEKNIVGLETDCSIKAGTPLPQSLVRQPICAERGEVITVIARKNNLIITVRAKALHKGRLGERITCENESSKRQLCVRLTGPREAELEL